MYKAMFFKKFLFEFFNEFSAAIEEGLTVDVARDAILPDECYYVTIGYCGKQIATVQKTANGTLFMCNDYKIRKTVKGLIKYAEKTKEQIRYNHISK